MCPGLSGEVEHPPGEGGNVKQEWNVDVCTTFRMKFECEEGASQCFLGRMKGCKKRWAAGAYFTRATHVPSCTLTFSMIGC